MKKLFTLLAIAMLYTSMAMAVPAHPGIARLIQPDGSELSIRLVGDEYLHFNTTEDGYSIVHRSDGYYVYAQLDNDGQLVPTTYIAHDEAMRSADEQAWLSQVKKYMTPKMSQASAREQQAENARRVQARQVAQGPNRLYDYHNFKGLILLVQFNDREFSREDYAEVINDMANMENYPGYDGTKYGKYTGSVRDYFYDNSDGLFSPQFDVVGPITIDYSQYHANGTSNVADLTVNAIEQADSLVDYSQYDGDRNGEVDMIYFIFAGLGSNMTGNDSRLIWPHASSIWRPNSGWNWQVICDGVAMGRYACSTELYGTNQWHILDGIGTICHEFSHVLGVMDLYDTDYESSGGESPHPGDWSIMAGGSYANYSRTPVGYTIYERYTMGFATPELISEEGSYTLEAVSKSNTGYRLDTPVKKEYFLFENRQNSEKWDKYLPGHGMLVYRVDSTNTNVWRENKVNCNPKHNYFELLRAKGANGSAAQSSDPFPGTGRVTMINNSTSPANLLTWSGKNNLLGVENIKEHSGVISFNIIDVNVLKAISLPNTATVGCQLNLQLTEERYPDTAPYTLEWSSSNTDIVTVNDKGLITGITAGEADIIVVANSKEELTDTCHVTVKEMLIAASIADYKELEPNTEAALLLNNALVVFVNGQNAFVRDETGAIVFSNTGLNLAVGDKLNGNVFGKFNVINEMPQLIGLAASTNDYGYALASGNKVEAREVLVADVSKADYGDLITLKTTSLENDGSIWAIGGENRIRLYNTFKLKGITVPNNYQGKYYDVTGVYMTNILNGTIIDELALTEKLKEVEAPVVDAISTIANDMDGRTPVSIYTTDGRLVTMTTVATLPQLNLRQGLYIAKTAQKTKTIIIR